MHTKRRTPTSRSATNNSSPKWRSCVMLRKPCKSTQRTLISNPINSARPSSNPQVSLSSNFVMKRQLSMQWDTWIICTWRQTRVWLLISVCRMLVSYYIVRSNLTSSRNKRLIRKTYLRRTLDLRIELMLVRKLKLILWLWALRSQDKSVHSQRRRSVISKTLASSRKWRKSRSLEARSRESTRSWKRWRAPSRLKKTLK